MTVTEDPASAPATASVAAGAGEVELAVSTARDQLADLVIRVAYGGESIILTRRGRRMAVLCPIPKAGPGVEA